MNQPFAVDPTDHTDPDRTKQTAGGRLSATGEPVISAKVTVAPLPPVHCVRPRLLTLMAPARRAGLTAVTGPTGSGKTTLASYWTRSGAAPGPVAWLTLDEQDNLPGIFWSYVLHVIQRHCPDADIRPPTHPGTVDQRTLTRLATSVAARKTPVTVVLDRCEAVTNPAIAAQLDVVLRTAGSGLQVIAVGRSTHLALPSRYRAAVEVTEIDADALALTVDETAEIASAYGLGLSPDEIEALYRSTEGWMAAVCLHALALRSGAASVGFPHPTGHQAVTEFLRTEILDAQPSQVRDVLLRTSILNELHPDLANRLTGRDDARGILDELVSTNCFVQRLDGGRYRHRRPLRNMLHDELTARHPDQVHHLHIRTAHWYAENGHYAEALRHAVKTGSWEYAVELAVNRLGVAWLLTSPDAEPYRLTLVQLPAHEATPAARVLRPVLALTNLDLPAARSAADEAATALRHLDSRPGPLRLALGAAQLVLSRYAGDADATLDLKADLDTVWRQLPPTEIADEACLRALILTNLGVATLWGGRFREARTALGRAATITDPGTEYMVHDALGHLALLHLYDGRLHEAARCARESLAVADRAGLRWTARVGAASVALASTALMWNDVSAVREHMSRAAVALTARLDPPTATALMLIRTRLAIARLDGRRALALIQAIREDCGAWRPSPVVTSLIQLTEVQANLVLRDTRTARRCLEPVPQCAERMLAAGQILATEGDRAGARSTLAAVSRHTDRSTTLQDAALSIAKLSFIGGDTPAAVRALRESLEYGRPEQHRLPFVEAGAWVRQLLRQRPDLAAEHRWLVSPSGIQDGRAEIRPAFEPLTKREIEVLGRLAEALSIEDIADALYLSVNTVKTHLKSIYRKLGASGRSAAARRARELKLLPEANRRLGP
jgi:LuxR family transcriptional regulator, maltose regulon positive regulatory protein